MVSGVYLLGGRASIHYASEMTRPVLESWQRYLYLYCKERLKLFSSWTQRTALQPLQVWFRWMTRQSLILANPAADPELPRLKKHLPRTILSLEQVEEILSLCNLTTLQGVRDPALRELLWSTGNDSCGGGEKVDRVQAQRHAGAVACAGEKGVSGQKVIAAET
jgi:site-specific recombinase XerD